MFHLRQISHHPPSYRYEQKRKHCGSDKHSTRACERMLCSDSTYPWRKKSAARVSKAYSLGRKAKGQVIVDIIQEAQRVGRTRASGKENKSVGFRAAGGRSGGLEKSKIGSWAQVFSAEGDEAKSITYVTLGQQILQPL